MDNIDVQLFSLEVVKWGGGGKNFFGDLFNLMARGGRKNISLDLSFIY